MQSRPKQLGSKDQKPKSVKSKRSKRQDNSLKSSSSTQNLTISQKGSNRLSLNHQLFQRKEIPISKASKVVHLLQQCKQYPHQSFKQLLNLYKDQPQLFAQFVKTQEQNEGRLIFVFIQRMALCFDHFPFFQQQKSVILLQRVLKILGDNTLPSPYQLGILQETNDIIWQNICCAKFQLVLQNLLVYFLQYSLLLGKNTNIETWNVGCKLISNNIKQLIIQLQSKKDKSAFFRNTLLKYFSQAFQLLSKSSQKSCKILPLYDITALSIVSQHQQAYKQILSIAINNFRKTDDKQIRQSQENRAIKENESMIVALFLNCNFFNLTSIFGQKEAPHHYSKEIILTVLILLKQNLMRSIDQLQRIEKGSIPNEVIRQLFIFSSIGNSLNRPQTLKEILSKVMAVKELHQCVSPLLVSNFHSSSEQQVEILHKAAEKALFELFYKIQKSICHFSIDIYMDLYIEHPLTFRSEYFISNLFQFQHLEGILKFMVGFTKRWILSDIKKFDFNFYLLQFYKKCVAKDNLHIISKYIGSLELQELFKINLITFKLSFQEQKKKLSIPQPVDSGLKLAHLTSAGFYDKFQVITKLLPDFSQQLLWKQIINSFNPIEHYIYVKAFYHIIHYQLNFSAQSLNIVDKIVDAFEAAVLSQKTQESYSIFHVFVCISFRLQHLDEEIQLNKQRIERKMLKIILQKHNQIRNLCEMTCERRRNAMSHMTLTQQMVNESIKYFEKIKRMQNHFIKNVVFWLNQLSGTEKLIQKSFQFEQAKQIYQKLSKQLQYPSYRFLRYLSTFSSQKHFPNLLKTKIKDKLAKKEIVFLNSILILHQAILSLVGKYKESFYCDQYCISFQEILLYFQHVLSFKMSVTNQREILKQKLIILELIAESLQYFSHNPNNEYFVNFKRIYNNAIKQSIIEIALQNPDYVQKYQRQLIIHLRMTAIKIILNYYQTPFQIFADEDLFSFVFELCFDKIVEIRFMLLNIFISRFKSEFYKRFLQCKYYVVSYLTVFAIFQPQAALNLSAKKAIEAIKKAGNEQCSLGLIVLLYSSKLLLSRIRKQFQTQSYFIFIDMFLKGFDQLWLLKKEWQALVYSFSTNFIQEKKISFFMSDLAYKSHITSYIIAREKSDFVLENEIKEYLKNQSSFSFEFPPQERQLDSKQTHKLSLLKSLPFRIFQRLRQIVTCKQRSTRVLKCKKDIKINWDLLKKEKIVQYHSQPQNFEIISLSMI